MIECKSCYMLLKGERIEDENHPLHNCDIYECECGHIEVYEN